jgi:hypothetical protein
MKTFNTVADRTCSVPFLGSKGNVWGSAFFLSLISGKIVSSDWWKSPPMDIGTINRINQMDRQGPLVPKKIPMYCNGRDIDDLVDPDRVDGLPKGRTLRVVVNSGRNAPDLSFSDEGLLRTMIRRRRSSAECYERIY